MTALERIAGGGGTYYISAASPLETDRDFESIQINEDAVISVLTYQNGGNAVTDLNLTGVTLYRGVVIFAPIGSSFKEIDLSSGSVLIS